MGHQTETTARGLREVLQPLLETEGIVGALLSSEDGLPLAACLGPGLDEEALAAAGARIGQLVRARLEQEELEAGVLDASRMKLVTLPASLGYLVVIAQPGMSTETVLEMARQAETELERAIREVAATD